MPSVGQGPRHNDPRTARAPAHRSGIDRAGVHTAPSSAAASARLTVARTVRHIRGSQFPDGHSRIINAVRTSGHPPCSPRASDTPRCPRTAPVGFG